MVFSFMPFKGKVRLRNPQHRFQVGGARVLLTLSTLRKRWPIHPKKNVFDQPYRECAVAGRMAGPKLGAPFLRTPS